MNKSQKVLYLSHSIQACVRQACDDSGLTEERLMARAGAAALCTIKTLYPEVKHLAIFCGEGHLAGCGYVLAVLGCQQGFSVVVYSCQPLDALPTATYHVAVAALEAGIVCQALEDGIDSDVELVVDALLDMQQDVMQESMVQAIHLMNESALPILALDAPSGLDADTGRVGGLVVKADVTVTFVGQKTGLFTLDGPDYCGKIVHHGLQLEGDLCLQPGDAYLLDDMAFQGMMIPRRKNSHKGSYGHVLVLGGGFGMPGAVSLSALAALRVGAGMVTVATWPQYAGHVLPLLPEAMIYPVVEPDDLLPLLTRATVCVVGPGLGEGVWARALFDKVVAVQLPLVVDASALRLLANSPQHDDNWILTPHPGEAAGLLSCSVDEVQNNRCESARNLQKQYGGCVILKGVGSVVTSGSATYLCPAGNPGMASAGMGDVLSGVLGGLLAQGLSLIDAANLGVWLHARAADAAVMTQGERGLMATDLMPHLRRQINALG